jgi:hypothetical protein
MVVVEVGEDGRDERLGHREVGEEWEHQPHEVRCEPKVEPEAQEKIILDTGPI